jgi:hypothetical protein
MSEQEYCTWCSQFGEKKPRKEGYALCERCYRMQEIDEEHNKENIHFICPNCIKDIGSRVICPFCGIVRYHLMSLPFHCKNCGCDMFYYKNNNTKGQAYCWCCNTPFKESSIDDYIMFALEKFEDYQKWKNIKQENEG